MPFYAKGVILKVKGYVTPSFPLSYLFAFPSFLPLFLFLPLLSSLTFLLTDSKECGGSTRTLNGRERERTKRLSQRLGNTKKTEISSRRYLFPYSLLLPSLSLPSLSFSCFLPPLPFSSLSFSPSTLLSLPYLSPLPSSFFFLDY